MKLLLDQNLSRYLARILAGTFPGTAHVQDFELDTSDDETICGVGSGLAIGI